MVYPTLRLCNAPLIRTNTPKIVNRLQCTNIGTYGSRVLNKPPDIGARIKRLAADKKVTHQQLAEVLGVSRNTLHRRFTGQSEFTLNQLVVLSHHWDMDIGDLLGDIGDNLHDAA